MITNNELNNKNRNLIHVSGDIYLEPVKTEEGLKLNVVDSSGEDCCENIMLAFTGNRSFKFNDFIKVICLG